MMAHEYLKTKRLRKEGSTMTAQPLFGRCLDGKVAVVTGAATGIGRGIAIRLAKEGADVVVADLNEDGAREVSDEISSMGRRALAVKVDVTSKRDVEAMIARGANEFGRIDIACNNAGVSTMNRVVDLTESEWDHNMNINAKGVFLSCQAEVKQMMKQGAGKIINTASMAAKSGFPYLAHYCASKFAVVGFSKALAREVAPFGITVNCVCPGFVKTGMHEREIVWEAKLRGISPDEVVREYIAMTPLGRLETPDDVAKVVMFLASPGADFMSGQAINVTGGAETH